MGLQCQNRGIVRNFDLFAVGDDTSSLVKVIRQIEISRIFSQNRTRDLRTSLVMSRAFLSAPLAAIPGPAQVDTSKDGYFCRGCFRSAPGFENWSDRSALMPLKSVLAAFLTSSWTDLSASSSS